MDLLKNIIQKIVIAFFMVIAALVTVGGFYWLYLIARNNG